MFHLGFLVTGTATGGVSLWRLDHLQWNQQQQKVIQEETKEKETGTKIQRHFR